MAAPRLDPDPTVLGKLNEGQGEPRTPREERPAVGSVPTLPTPSPRKGKVRAVDLLTSRLISFQRRLGLHINPSGPLPAAWSPVTV